MYITRREFLQLSGSLLLSSCGGGGGSQPSPLPPGKSNTVKYYGYFGVYQDQIKETVDHVNLVHLPDWSKFGDPASAAWRNSENIRLLQQAVGLGIKSVVLSIGQNLFGSKYEYLGINQLVAYKTQLDQLGLSKYVVGLYPLDEPDIAGISDTMMILALSDIKAVWPDPKLWVIYGNSGSNMPGYELYDVLGRDLYDVNGESRELAVQPKLKPNQTRILVPGGSDPWRMQPQPFVDWASTQPVECIMPFKWFDGLAGGKGIRSNGLAETYRAVGKKIIGD